MQTHASAILQVIIYDGQTKDVARTISRFKDMAYSGSFRSDGKLVVAGSQDGIVQVRSTAAACDLIRTLMRKAVCAGCLS